MIVKDASPNSFPPPYTATSPPSESIPASSSSTPHGVPLAGQSGPEPLAVPLEPQYTGKLSHQTSMALLPPGPFAVPPDQQIDTPEQQELWARCARGDHDVLVKHGPAGIIAAVFLFPVGLLCFIMDVDKRCKRCGAIIPR